MTSTIASSRTYEETIKDIETTLLHTQNNYRLIGQYHNTYLLIEKEDGLFLIDQHAAHERILYERYSAALTGSGMAAQRSLFLPKAIFHSLRVLLLPSASLMERGWGEVALTPKNCCNQ
jgi:DNA mismatch repair protein MutL